MSESDVLTIHIDGAARGNPGPAAYAFVIQEDGKLVDEHKETLGRTTNNIAEYTALVHALARAAEIGADRPLAIYSDSELLVKQMNGEYKVKNEGLLPLYQEARELTRRFGPVHFHHVRRELNKHADRLCNEALDGAGSRESKPVGARKKAAGRMPKERQESVREEAIVCLQNAAVAWARGDASMPPADQVWDQLWTILEENGVLRSTRSP